MDLATLATLSNVNCARDILLSGCSSVNTIETTTFAEERSELESVLASDLFARSPNLGQFLSYVCERYFEGAHEVKEYDIAVEALGRRADFDPKTDSIVRVEAHRLRHRLKEYYEHDEAGRERSVALVLRPGRYIPLFVARQSKPAVLPAALRSPTGPAIVAVPASAELAANPQSPVHQEPPWTRGKSLWLIAAVVLLLALAAATVYSPRERRVRRPAGEGSIQTPAPETASPAGNEIRILAGSDTGKYVDRSGQVWSRDRFFKGGSTSTRDYRPVFRTRDPMMFLKSRTGEFSYDIPLKPGIYELRLHFAEVIFGEFNMDAGGEGSRRFNVFLNGKPLLSGLDVTSDANGANTADVKVFKDVSPMKDGMLHLKFERPNAFVNAIEIVPGNPGRLRPIRMFAGDFAYSDREGRLWWPDSNAVGGRAIVHKDQFAGAPEPELYQAERFGHFSYQIPVAPGRYSVTLRFAEAYFGPGHQGGGGPNDRLFSVYCNHIPLLHDFDVFDAGGNLPLVKTFKGLRPNAQGKLVLSFEPVLNYAFVNAIEVLDEGDGH